jgi:general secretion pathway protein K
VALLLVLWVFTILGVLALDFARYMRDDAMAALNFVEETRGYYTALAGMNRTLWEAMVSRDEKPEAGLDDEEAAKLRPAGMREDDLVPADGKWHEGTFVDAKYEVRMTDEEGRIAINTVGEPLLTRVVTNLLVGDTAQGVDRREQNRISEVVDGILDWRDGDGMERPHGAESKWYRANGGYESKDARFDDPQELLKIRGMTAELYYGREGMPGLRDVISVFSKKPGVNARSVTVPVLQALLGLTPEEAEEQLALRDESLEAFQTWLESQLTLIDPGLEGAVFDGPASLVLIEARADTAQPRNRSFVAAVVLITDDDFGEPRIVRWFDRAPFTGALPAGEVPERPEDGA